MDTDFCVSALEEALKKYGKPAINTTKGVSLPVSLSRKYYRTTALMSPWMAVAAGWIMSLPNAFGDLCNMKTCI
jgi:hypothetical protein